MHAFLTNGQKEGYEEQVSICWHYVRYFIFVNQHNRKPLHVVHTNYLMGNWSLSPSNQTRKHKTRTRMLIHKVMKCDTKAKPSKVGKNTHHRATGSLHELYLWPSAVQQTTTKINWPSTHSLCVFRLPPQYPSPASQPLKRRKDNILGKQWRQASEGLFWEHGRVKT